MAQNFKLLLILLLALHSISVYATTKESIRFIFNGYKITGGKGCTEFRVHSGMPQTCGISLLALPAEYPDSTFSYYTIVVNGTECPEKLTFGTGGWQEAATPQNAITLSAGDNIIRFVSSGKDLPQIKAPEVYRNTGRTAGNFNKTVNSAPASGITRTDAKTAAGQSVVTEPMCRPGYFLNQAYTYTFCLPIYYEAGDRATFYGLSAYRRDYNLYLYHENPAIFSQSATSSGGCVDWDTVIPQTGLYYMLLESKDYGEWDGVTILVNNNTTYRNAYISNSIFNISKGNMGPGVTVSSTNSHYNMFTVNPRPGDEYHDADPHLWLKEERPGGMYTIVAYSDGNTVNSDFDWEKNARIRTMLSDTSVYTLLLASSYPDSYANDTCDVYFSYWNETTLRRYFSEAELPNLIIEDAIESGVSGYYNCISLTAGINFKQMFPYDPYHIEWFDSLYMNETVRMQENGEYFSRHYGMLKYTREGATEENSVIDVYGKPDESGNIRFTHAAIRKYSDSYGHGYDWESKLGQNTPKIFHPRRSLEGGIYGDILYSYRVADNQSNAYRSIEEAIAGGEVIVEDLTLTPDEERQLEAEAGKIRQNISKGFETLYSAWKLHTGSLRSESDTHKHALCKEYRAVSAFINQYPGCALLLYGKYVKGDREAALPIREAALAPVSGKARLWKSIMDAPPPGNIIRTDRYNINLFIKSVLQKSEEPQITGLIRSNEDSVNAYASAGKITIDIDIKKTSAYSVKIINLATYRAVAELPEREALQGTYTHNFQASPGLYLVTCIIDGNINSKKIVVH